jgi:hypothetical protein
MKQRKIAISLAVIGAIVAPFVLHIFYEIDYAEWRTWAPLTAAGIQQIKVNLANCSSAECPMRGLVANGIERLLTMVATMHQSRQWFFICS